LQRGILKNYRRISCYKSFKWQINTKSDQIMVMNAIVFRKSHGNGHGNGNGNGQRNVHGNGNGNG
jgi:hypothetical protein